MASNSLSSVISPIFADTSDLSKAFREAENKKKQDYLNLYFCDDVVDKIMATVDPVKIKEDILEKIKSNNFPKVSIWSTEETTFNRPEGELFDNRNQRFKEDERFTVQEWVTQNGWNNVISSVSGAFPNRNYVDTTRYSEIFRKTDALLILSGRFGDNFRCSTFRNLIRAEKQYHVYRVEIMLTWYARGLSPAWKNSITTALTNQKMRLEKKAEEAAEEAREDAEEAARLSAYDDEIAERNYDCSCSVCEYPYENDEVKSTSSMPSLIHPPSTLNASESIWKFENEEEKRTNYILCQLGII
jgi:hypothetical protein